MKPIRLPMRLLLVALCVTAASTIAATASASAPAFDWVQVDPIDVTTNPAFLHGTLALTHAGEPVRARLIVAKTVIGFTTFGDYVLDRHDPSGTLDWSMTLTGQLSIDGIAIDSNGGIVIHGGYVDQLTIDPAHELVNSSGQVHEFLIKLDANRNVLWLIDASAEEQDLDRIDALVVDENDRVWLGLSHFLGTTFVRRLHGDGTVDIEYEQQNTIRVTGLAVDADGTVWAAGPSASGPASFNGFQTTAPFTYNAYLVKYGPNTVTEWVHYVEDETMQEPRVASDGSGAVYFSGALHGIFAFGNLFPEGIDWVYDFFLTKVSAEGEFLWLREVPADGLAGDAGVGGASYVTSPHTNGVYYVGFSRLEVDWDGDGQAAPGFGGQDVLVLHYSPDGDLLWSKNAGSAGLDVADAVAVDETGNVFLAGTVAAGSTFDGIEHGGSFANAFLAALPRATTAVNGDGPAPTHLGIRSLAAPNPFSHSTRIELNSSDDGFVRLRVFDATGKLVDTISAGTHRADTSALVWDGRSANGLRLANGIYFYELTTHRGTTRHRVTLLR